MAELESVSVSWFLCSIEQTFETGWTADLPLCF